MPVKYFFDNTADLIECLPVTAAYDFAEIKPFLESAAQKYLRHEMGIGKELFDQILQLYNDGYSSLSDPNKKLVGIIRKVVINFAMFQYVPFGIVNIGKEGITQLKKDDREPLRKWQSDQLQEKFLTEGFDAIDQLLEFLEENKTDFPTWTTSPAYSLSKNEFINSTSEFSKFYPLVRSRRTYLFLRPYISRVDQFSILEALGQSKYDEIKLQIKNGPLTDENKNLLLLIQPAVAHLTMSLALDHLNVSINERGIQVLSMASNTDNQIESRSISEAKLKSLKEQAQNTGTTYLQKLIKSIQPTTPDISGSRLNDSDSKSYYV
jgi:hypothetical protein